MHLADCMTRLARPFKNPILSRDILFFALLQHCGASEKNPPGTGRSTKQPWNVQLLRPPHSSFHIPQCIPGTLIYILYRYSAQ